MFIDAAIVYGQSKTFSTSLYVVMDEDDTTSDYIVKDGTKFVPLDLTEYSIKFKIMGAATANASVLVEHLITQVSDLEVDGQITNATNGEFSFTVSAEDTIKVGLGKHPIMLELVDVNTLDHQFTLTEGGQNGEFNKIFVVQV